MIRVAAVADVHFGLDSEGTLAPHLEKLPERADVFILGGDLTRCGESKEAAVLARELDPVEVPVVAVLGNHDYHAGEEKAIRDTLEEVGVVVLEGEATTIATDAGRVGIAGSKGFGGGFAGACGTDFGEPEMKAFIRHTKEVARAFEDALASLDSDVRVGVLHYAPVEDTLQGERLEIFPFLGSYLLGEALDRVGADLVLHGHAHRGAEKGITPGGIHVRNVAAPVIGHAYNVYCLGDARSEDC